MILSTGKNPLPKRTKAGFTFIELMLVTVIIGIIISISTPLFQRTFDAIQLENLAANLTKLMQYSREKAIVERLQYRIVFDIYRGQYRLEVEEDPLNNPGEFYRLKSRWGKENSIPEGISLEMEKNAINFYPDGRISQSTIYLTNKNGKTYTLITERTLGRVQIFNYRKIL